MRLLLTNDDGINAQGLAALEAIAFSLSDDVWICAPEGEQSGASRSLTLSEPLRVRRLDDRRFAVRGTPTDCVMLGVQHLVAGAKPDLVLLSAGFDAHHADPIGDLGLGDEDFLLLLKDVRAVADAYCGGKLVSLLEGGYNLDALSRCVVEHVRALASSERL